MIWGVNGEQGKRIGVNEVRVGCYREPYLCINNLRSLPLSGIRMVSIAFIRPENAQNGISYAKIYSGLAKRDGIVGELSIDDFYEFVEKLPRGEEPGYLLKIIDAIKADGGGLKLGVTVYEDQLAAISSDSRRFPLAVRKGVDRVALYLHYRSSVYRYRELIAAVKDIFPNAKLYLGIYNYDRRDYIPCAIGSKDLCSESEEMVLFRTAFLEQVGLLRGGKVDGMEFYPGNFGSEGRWEGWRDDRLCSFSRKKNCVDNSRKMNEMIEKALE